MDAMITNIRRDAGYYCEKAMGAFENKNFINSVKFLNKAEKVAVGGEKLEIYFILGLMYNCMEDYTRSSEYFMLSLLSRPLQSKAVRSMFENAVTEKNLILANKYKELFMFTEADKKEKEAVNKVFEFLHKELKPKIREVKIEDSQEFQKDYNYALDLYEDEHFDEAIEVLNKYDYKKSQETRELLIDCYYMAGKSDIAINLLSREEMTNRDKISMVVVLNELGREEEKKVLIEEIKKAKLNEVDLFKFALSLLESDDMMLCLETLEKFLKIKPYDKNANNLYASICLGLGLFSKAKDKLLDLKEVGKLDVIYYLEMLKLCEKNESPKTYDYFTMCKNFDRKLKSKLKAVVEYSDDKFEEVVSCDEAFVKWVATINDKHLKNLFFTRAAKILGLKDLFQQLYVAEEVDKTLKQIIISRRLDLGYNEDYVVSYDGNLIGFVPLSMKNKKNEVFYKAYTLLVNRIIGKSSNKWIYNLNYYFDNIKEFCKEGIEDPYILAAIIYYEFDSFRNKTTIRETCKYFNISQEDFWKFYISDK